MNTIPRAGLLSLALCHPLLAQQPATNTAEASTSRDAAVQERSFCLRYLGRQLSDPAWINRLGAMLTPNTGSLAYSASEQTLVVCDHGQVVDALAAEIVKLDVEPVQIQLGIRVVKISDLTVGARVLAGNNVSCGHGAAILTNDQALATMRGLHQEQAKIISAPQIVACAGQAASIFIGEKRDPRLLPDGGVATPLDADTIDIHVTTSIQPETGLLAVDFQMRSLFTSADGAVFCQPVLLASGNTAVVQRVAGPALGALIFITPQVITSSSNPLPAHRLSRTR